MNRESDMMDTVVDQRIQQGTVTNQSIILGKEGLAGNGLLLGRQSLHQLRIQTAYGVDAHLKTTKMIKKNIYSY